MTIAADTADRAERRHRVRIHEAGHAIVGVLQRGDVDVVGVIVFGCDQGGTHVTLPGSEETARMSAAEFRAHLEACALLSLAGEAASEVFGDPDPRRGAEVDRATALEAARRLDAAPLAGAATLATVGRLYSRALGLARQHRAAIGRFADTLAANHDRLAAEEVGVALEAAFGDWPTPAFDHKSKDRIMTRTRALFEIHVRDTDSAVERIVLRRHCEAAAWAGLSLAEYRRIGLYAPPLKGA